jgi:predicted neuraminidase
MSTTVTRAFVTIDDPPGMQCHASTVAVTPDGPVFAWFAGTREGAPDTRIHIAGPSGTRVLDTGRDAAHWNPVLAPGPDGALWLFCKVGPRISEWITFVTRSTDSGVTWEPVRELVPGDRSGGRGPVKNPPLSTPDGLWLAPASVEEWGERPRWSPFVDVSADGGATWERAQIPVYRPALHGAGHIQPALWWGPAGPVALMRSSEGRAYRATSPDGGRTWGPPIPTDLPNGNSGLAAVALPSGRVVCVHNPVAQDWGPRCPLVVSVSDDDGRTWRRALVIDDGTTPVDPAVPVRSGPVADLAAGDGGVMTTGAGEYSYPTAVLDGDRLLVSYTWQRRGIVLAQVPLSAFS